ncbi:MAG: hypothetical protein CVV22_02440 [Ignavibacteriae bacterium HGW-Ignavibacteriae-1]|jgi:aminopeptidase N|nr:MAG: hypothetical protein CVV22_02440 [Ignavibacteriae bacterium HGW-Ignavibacteriae-1]
MKIIFVTVVFLAFCTEFFGQSNPKSESYPFDAYKQPVDMTVDIIHIKGELKIEPIGQVVDGIATMSFRTLRPRVDSLIFHSPEIVIKSIKIKNDSIAFKIVGNQTIAYPKDNLDYQGVYEMVIDYRATPTEGLYFTGWNDPSDRMRKQIWAHSPGNWMPFINQKHDILTSEFIVTFDSKYKVFSNGDRLMERDNNDGTKTWHYKLDKPHVVYLICLVIGEYDYRTLHSKSGVPLEMWYYPDLADRFETTYMHMEAMVDFFEEEIGIKYPWSIYRQAPLNNYLYGGMETTTATVFGDYMYIDPRAWWMRNYVNVNVHELNHQWFGNLISHLNNKHVWLTESFATYYAKIFEREIFGEDYYQWERVKEYERTMHAAKVNDLPVGHSQGGTDRWYPKGSLVLDMMRNFMGDTLFRTAFKYYAEQHSHKVTETYDLLKAIRESTGMALDWFFDQWILRGGEPHFQFKWDYTKSSDGANIIRCDIAQVHPTSELIGYFKVPLRLDVYYKDGKSESFNTWVDSNLAVRDFPVREKPLFLIFDPERKILKKLRNIRDIEQIKAQALMAKNMIDRYDAVLELDKFPIDDKRATLHKAFKQEKYQLVKSEIIRQIANDDKSYDIFVQAINSGDEWVVRSVVTNITKVPQKLEKEYRKILTDSCYINVEKSLENLTKSFPDKDYLTQTKDEIGWRGKNIRIKWIELAIAKGQQEFTAELVDYTSISFDFETRINAFNALLNLKYYDRHVVSNLISAYLDWQFKLSNSAKEVMLKFAENEKFKTAIKNYLKQQEFTEKQRVKIERLGL